MSAINGVPEGQRVLTADEVRSDLQQLNVVKNCRSYRVLASQLALEGRDAGQAPRFLRFRCSAQANDFYCQSRSTGCSVIDRDWD